MSELPPLLTVDQVAAMLECEPTTIEKALRERRLPGIQYGRPWLLPREALLAELNRQATANLTKAEPTKPAAVLMPTGRRGRTTTLPTLV